MAAAQAMLRAASVVVLAAATLAGLSSSLEHHLQILLFEIGGSVRDVRGLLCLSLTTLSRGTHMNHQVSWDRKWLNRKW